MSDKLKPCPFCGYKKSVVDRYKGGIIISCEGRFCGCALTSLGRDSLADATRKWNTRASLKSGGK